LLELAATVDRTLTVICGEMRPEASKWSTYWSFQNLGDHFFSQ
jgi:hypothetical protein